MVEPVLMPQVGQNVKTARIIKWLKKENDEVREGDVIATVESDKAVLDVEAYATGVLLKILHGEGQEVDVLTPIAYIGRPGEKIDAWASPADATEAHEESVGATGTAAATRAERVGMPVSPSARRLSREKGIDPETLRGTGPGGRITKQDVLAAKGAGTHCVVTTNGFTEDEDFSEADLVIPELGDPPNVRLNLEKIRTIVETD